MYSAKKIEGKKLYELARKGETVERNAVTVKISELELSEPPALAGGQFVGLETMSESLPNWPPANAAGSDPASTASLRVVCSAGTYIRTLAEDIGRKLGTGAHLQELRRTRAGKFSIDRSVTLDQLADSIDPAASLIPMEDAISHLPRIDLNADRSAKTRSGLSSRLRDLTYPDGAAIAMFDHEEKLIAIGIYNAEQNAVQPKIVLV